MGITIHVITEEQKDLINPIGPTLQIAACHISRLKPYPYFLCSIGGKEHFCFSFYMREVYFPSPWTKRLVCVSTSIIWEKDNHCTLLNLCI